VPGQHPTGGVTDIGAVGVGPDALGQRSEKKWADQAGKLAGAARKRCGWQWSSFHWLRHGWASWSLAPESDGRHGITPTRVRMWLGHTKLSTTTDTYVHEPRGDDSHICEATRRLPGQGTGE
jgi:integrase